MSITAGTKLSGFDDGMTWAAIRGRAISAGARDIEKSVHQAGTDTIFSLGRVMEISDLTAVQSLMTDLARRAVAEDPDAIDCAIVDALKGIADLLALDRTFLWERARADAPVVATHCWIAQRDPAAPEPPALASTSFVRSKLDAGEPGWFGRIDDLSDAVDREAFERCDLRSMVVVPMSTAGDQGTQRALGVASMRAQQWTPALVNQLKLASAVIGQALARQASLRSLQDARDELRQLRTQPDRVYAAAVQPRSPDGWQGDARAPRPHTQDAFGNGIVVGQSTAVRGVLDQIRQVAATDSTVLLLGETGTGKELFATQIHELSARRGRPMVRVNCSAIPATLMESELFGRDKGAFTGALARQIGRFELADHSTIFLDEIGDVPAEIQVKLLRVLEERQIERLGNPRGIHVDVRIIAATHRNLEQKIASDDFREDLFYRLNVFPIQVPPLRERFEDIPLLVWRFVEEFSKAFGKRVDTIPRETMAALQRYSWPGNIRELRNVVERAMIVATGPRLSIPLPAQVLPPQKAPAARRSARLTDVEHDHIRSVLEISGWRIRGEGGAAERLGLKPTTLETRMTKLGIHRPGA